VVVGTAVLVSLTDMKSLRGPPVVVLVLWLVWPPRTKTCNTNTNNNDNDNTNDIE
jgi:hypothetical protein